MLDHTNLDGVRGYQQRTHLKWLFENVKGGHLVDYGSRQLDFEFEGTANCDIATTVLTRKHVQVVLKSCTQT